jgi:putative addiction module antidote
MLAFKITTVGNSEGVILPREVRDRLGVQKGDTIFLTEAPGGYRLTANDPDFARQMESAERMMRRYRNTLAALAK